MKLERINDRQIRCTLTHEDLSRRGLRLSEFAYGTKKARALFQEMMEQASVELGFEAEDYPLMIEAVPVNSECLVLIVTLVDDPEELDTRFSAFGPMLDEMDETDDEAGPDGFFPADDEEAREDNSFYRLLRGMQDGDFSSLSEQFAAHLTPAGVQQLTGRSQPKRPNRKGRDHSARIFSFSALHEVRGAAAKLEDIAGCASSTLYRDEKRTFYLCLKPLDNEEASKAFVPLCALLAEYGAAVVAGTITEEYLQEHCEVVIRKQALQSLASI